MFVSGARNFAAAREVHGVSTSPLISPLMPSLRRASLGFTLLVLLAACTSDGSLQPTSLDGTWVIVTANEQALPAVVHDITYPIDGEHVQVFVTHDTIVVSGGSYRQQALTYSEVNGVRAGTLIIGDHGLVTRDGGAVHFDSGYYDGRTFDAMLTGGDLVVVQDLAAQGSTARYLLRRLAQ